MQLKMRRHAKASNETMTWYEVVSPTGERKGWVRKMKGTKTETFPWQAYRTHEGLTAPDGGPQVGPYVGAWYGGSGAKADAMHAAAGLGP